MCPEWRESFPQFLSDMGYKPTPKHSLDRIDSNGNYEPSNCRWSTPMEQAANTSRNRSILINGERLNLGEAIRKYGVVPKGTITSRIHRGWDDVKAITTPA